MAFNQRVGLVGRFFADERLYYPSEGFFDSVSSNTKTLRSFVTVEAGYPKHSHAFRSGGVAHGLNTAGRPGST